MGWKRCASADRISVQGYRCFCQGHSLLSGGLRAGAEGPEGTWEQGYLRTTTGLRNTSPCRSCLSLYRNLPESLKWIFFFTP